MDFVENALVQTTFVDHAPLPPLLLHELSVDEISRRLVYRSSDTYSLADSSLVTYTIDYQLCFLPLSVLDVLMSYTCGIAAYYVIAHFCGYSRSCTQLELCGAHTPVCNGHCTSYVNRVARVSGTGNDYITCFPRVFLVWNIDEHGIVCIWL